MLSCEVDLNLGRFSLEARLECDGGITGLFGHSGSGKSTLLGIIAGLIRPGSGRVVLDGEVLIDTRKGICKPAHRRRVGLVFQDSQLFPQYSVKGNLLYGFERLRPAERRFRFDEIVDLMALGPLLNAHPRQISGGEKQRVALGRSLLASPRLLLLDEPLASLDEGLKEQILPFLDRIKRDLALPMIYVSHALPEILYLTDRLSFMAGGRITASGRLSELLASHPRERMSGLDDDNILAVKVQAHDVVEGYTLGAVEGSEVFLPLRSSLIVGETAYVSVARGEVALARAKVEGLSIQNQIPGTIVRVDYRSGAVVVELDVGTPLRAEITPRAWRCLQLREGDQAYCLIKTRAIEYLAERKGGASSLPVSLSFGSPPGQPEVIRVP
jgi:molybdate transport system ATP-binding protein